MGTVSQLATAVEDDEIVFRLATPSTSRRREGLVRRRPGRRPRPGTRSRVAGSCGCRCRSSTAWSTSSTSTAHLVPDPGNPDRVEGAFGAHSWLALPATSPRPGSTLPPAPGERRARADRRGRRSTSVVWEPAGHAERAAAAAGPRRPGDGRRTAACPLRRRADRRRPDAADAGRAARPRRRPRRALRREPGVRRRADRRGRCRAITEAFATTDLPVLLGQSLGGGRGPARGVDRAGRVRAGCCSSPARSSPRSSTRRSRATGTGAR